MSIEMSCLPRRPVWKCRLAVLALAMLVGLPSLASGDPPSYTKTLNKDAFGDLKQQDVRGVLEDAYT